MCKTVTSIEIKHESWGCIRRDQISKSTLSIYKSGQMISEFYNQISKSPIETYKYKIGKKEIDEFFSKLFTKVKVLKWNDDYSVQVCDGYHWDVIINFFDKSIKKVCGTVEPPTNGKLLEEMIYKLTKYEATPMIF